MKIFAKKPKTKGYPRGYTPTDGDIAVDNFVKNVLKPRTELNYNEEDYKKLIGKTLQIFDTTTGEDKTFTLIDVPHLEYSIFGNTHYLLVKDKNNTCFVFHPHYQDESYCFIHKIKGKPLDGFLSLSDHQICADLVSQFAKPE